MNSRGSVAITLAAALLVTAVVGVIIVDQVAAQVWVATAVTNESLGVVTNGTVDALANNCLAAAPTSVYDWTNGTDVVATNYTLAPGAYPNRIANTITWDSGAAFAANNSIIGVNYTYGCSYGTNTTFRLVMEYLAIIMGVLVLTLAGGWLYLKGGL